MRALAAVLLLVTAGLGTPARAQDGGSVLVESTAPFANPDAGVYEVASATLIDGGVLPSGWWLSRPRMQKVGEHVALLQGENEQLKHQLSTTEQPMFSGAFWAGLGIGSALGIAATVLLVTQLR